MQDIQDIIVSVIIGEPVLKFESDIKKIGIKSNIPSSSEVRIANIQRIISLCPGTYDLIDGTYNARTTSTTTTIIIIHL